MCDSILVDNKGYLFKCGEYITCLEVNTYRKKRPVSGCVQYVTSPVLRTPTLSCKYNLVSGAGLTVTAIQK